MLFCTVQWATNHISSCLGARLLHPAIIGLGSIIINQLVLSLKLPGLMNNLMPCCMPISKHWKASINLPSIIRTVPVARMLPFLLGIMCCCMIILRDAIRSRISLRFMSWLVIIRNWMFIIFNYWTVVNLVNQRWSTDISCMTSRDLCLLQHHLQVMMVLQQYRLFATGGPIISHPTLVFLMIHIVHIITVLILNPRQPPLLTQWWWKQLLLIFNGWLMMYMSNHFVMLFPMFFWNGAVHWINSVHMGYCNCKS